MFSKTAIIALFAGLVAGQATPKGEPMGNPITRPLNEVCFSSRTHCAKSRCRSNTGTRRET